MKKQNLKAALRTRLSTDTVYSVDEILMCTEDQKYCFIRRLYFKLENF